MATITKSIGTSSRDYSTITLWEADLDDTTPYDAADDAVGEMYDDSAFDESVTLNGGGTIGLASTKLTAATGEAHDGTAGTGARAVCSVDDRKFILDNGDNTIPVVLEFFEWDHNGKKVLTPSAVDMLDESNTVGNCLVHDLNDTTWLAIGIRDFPGSTGDLGRVINNIVYDVTSGGTANATGIEAPPCLSQHYIRNNTVHNVTAGGTGLGIGFKIADDVDIAFQNNIATDAADTDYEPASFSNATVSHNLASDTTASGTGSLDSKTAANQFVSTTGGSEDLHIKTGADAIDAGTDLVTTPTGVNIDINGRDRDSEGDTWDMGAHEFVAAASGRVMSSLAGYGGLAGHGGIAGTGGGLAA